MTSQALDYPAELAERAYAHSQVPNKAAKEKAAFDEHMEEVKEMMGAIAKTERQRTMLDFQMENYRRTYVAQLSEILQLRIDMPVTAPARGQLSALFHAEFAFSKWQRRAQRDMKYDILNAEHADARWVDRAQMSAIAGGRGV